MTMINQESWKVLDSTLSIPALSDVNLFPNGPNFCTGGLVVSPCIPVDQPYMPPSEPPSINVPVASSLVLVMLGLAIIRMLRKSLCPGGLNNGD